MSKRRRICLLDVVEVVKESPGTAVLPGARGTVVDIDHDRYWVEFVDADGDVIALAQYTPTDLRVVWSSDSQPTIVREQ